MFYVYVLKSKALNRTYVGHTRALEKRMFQHRRGESSATKHAEDWELVYSEEYPTKTLAVKREKYLKSGDGRKVLRFRGVV